MNLARINTGLIIFAATVITVGCSRRDTTQRKIQAAVRSGRDEIKLKELTPFDWDEVVIGRFDATRSELEGQVGELGEHFLEFSRNVVFIKNGRSIHYEQWQVNVEHPLNGEVMFEKENIEKIIRFGANVKFHAVKMPIPNGECYLLSAEEQPAH